MTTDTLQRRLRTAPPVPTIRRLVLTDADYLLFEAIDRHGPLPSNYLYEFTRHLRRDRTHLQNRLTEFYNGDARGPYLTRPPQQFAGYQARYQHLAYDLASRARYALAERGMGAGLAPRTDPFVHRLMTACVMASIELTAPALGLRYVSCGEILVRPECETARRAPNPLAVPLLGRGTLIPDGLFGFHYPGAGFRFFAVEIDRNTESLERTNLAQSSFGRKVTGYATLLKDQLYRTWWGIPNLHILIVTTNAIHGRNILEFVKRQSRQYPERFAVAVEPAFGANWYVPSLVLRRLITEPWHSPIGDKEIGVP